MFSPTFVQANLERWLGDDAVFSSNPAIAEQFTSVENT